MMMYLNFNFIYLLLMYAVQYVIYFHFIHCGI